jgi:flagellar motor switch protein FliG
MIQNLESSAPPITGLRKAAILMIILGDKVSGEILRQMDEEEVQAIGQEVARITSISPDQAESVLEEFYQMSMAREFVLKGGIDYAKKMLMTAFGPEHAMRLVDRLVKTLGSELASFDALQKADPQQLAKFIHNEHPQTIALILSHLNASQAAGLLISLPQELRADVALRMASLDQISPEIVSKIAIIIGQRLKALGEMSRESYGGVRAVAEMFNRLDSGSSKDILESIEEADPKLVETIRHLMFVFEDLLFAERRSSEGNAGQSRAQNLDHRAQGHQRTTEKSHPATHVPARRGNAQGGYGGPGAHQDQRGGGGAAADHCRDPATGGGRHDQPEGNGR